MGGLLRRRDVLTGSAAAMALALDGRLYHARAQAKSSVTGVTWGGPWINAWKQLATSQNAVNINWVLHEAATTAIVAKIKASWPYPPVDFINASSPTMFAMMREDWLEPLTQETISNLAHLPPDLMIKNSAGDIVSIPMNLSSVFWAYDEQALGMRIEKPDDLLSPKLRGKLMLNAPTIGSGAQLVSLARARGGGEHNVEPGFGFIKDLIKAEIVGRVVKTDVDIVNAFTTGEVAVGVLNMGNYHEIRNHVNLTLLNKMPDSPTFKSFIGSESVAILKKGGNRQPVKDFLNFCLGADNDSEYAANVGSLPGNELGKASPDLAAFLLADEKEREKFAVYPDVGYISSQTAAWNQKWELEIAPLL